MFGLVAAMGFAHSGATEPTTPAATAGPTAAAPGTFLPPPATAVPDTQVFGQLQPSPTTRVVTRVVIPPPTSAPAARTSGSH